MADLEVAVRLVRQAVVQDSKRNYPEASRCYKEAILRFCQFLEAPGLNPALVNAIHARIKEYEDRLRVIDRHLLAQTDLTKLLKDLEVGGVGEEECGSSVSSQSTTTRHLYKNPRLVCALDSLRRGRKADERRHLRLAVTCYEAGLAGLMDLVNKGVLTPRQEVSAREKCLLYHERVQLIRDHIEEGRVVRERNLSLSSMSLNSASESPVPETETDNLLQMDEVKSCSSQFGSRQSLNQSFDHRDSINNKSFEQAESLLDQSLNHSSEQTEAYFNNHFRMNHKDAVSVGLSGAKDGTEPASLEWRDESFELNRTHETLHGSLPQIFKDAASRDQAVVARSTHSLYPNCEIKRPPTAMSGISDVPRYVKPVPLADLNKELSLSAASLKSTGSCGGGGVRKSSFASVRSCASIHSTRSIHSSCQSVNSCSSLNRKLDTVDTLESELVNLSASIDNIKDDDDTGSDSGYSDPSPDARDGKSPAASSASSAGGGDRGKSPFSDIGDEAPAAAVAAVEMAEMATVTAAAAAAEIVPHVIINNESQQADQPDQLPRSYRKQRSLFQNPAKDILTSSSSQDNLVVVDDVDGPRTAASQAAVAASLRPEVYNRRPSGAATELVPSRAMAARPRRTKEEKDGCYYVVAALDFCWCL